MSAYEYRHVVGFGETNLVGNVYFAHIVGWQGRCRELFLRDHAPTTLQRLRDDLVLVTTNVSCRFFAEIFALDEIAVEMVLDDAVDNRLAMRFRYTRESPGGHPQLVADGAQEIACLRRDPDLGLVPEPVPTDLRHAAEAYTLPERSTPAWAR